MRPTNDLHVIDTQPLLTPDGMKADLPISPAAAELVYRTREEIRDLLRGRDSRLLVVVGPCSVHDPKAALDYAERLHAAAPPPPGRAPARHARVLREAADDGGLEGPGQRSAPQRKPRHRRRPPHRAGAPRAPRGRGDAGGDRGPRPDRAAVPRGRRVVGGHRRPDHREPDAPRDGERPLHARRVQERDRRRAHGRHPRAGRRVASAQFPGRRRRRPGRDCSHRGQPRRARRPSGRQRGTELRRGARRGGGGGAREGGRPVAHARRLQPRQQREEPPPAAPRHRGGRAPGGRGIAAHPRRR